ncbi:hypothetical protein C427_5206 [Paraglaciecola psychrophila 170]|uniref:Uncharacterized protein n=1 Tax=Paraglaciecola psychrophila 170 TaxID=1129794 RepID=K6ZKQ7_9ALTE|nr:hypothetical protein C427_5206 [Paraglaciecola psychrophila 170]GAC36561.1 hypothetical protein GPSY_0923 [Paraglaciecola psychrophila 170]
MKINSLSKFEREQVRSQFFDLATAVQKKLRLSPVSEGNEVAKWVYVSSMWSDLHCRELTECPHCHKQTSVMSGTVFYRLRQQYFSVKAKQA